MLFVDNIIMIENVLSRNRCSSLYTACINLWAQQILEICTYRGLYPKNSISLLSLVVVVLALRHVIIEVLNSLLIQQTFLFPLLIQLTPITRRFMDGQDER